MVEVQTCQPCRVLDENKITFLVKGERKSRYGSTMTICRVGMVINVLVRIVIYFCHRVLQSEK